MLLKFCTQYQQTWKTRQWPQYWKRTIFTSIPNKGNAKLWCWRRLLKSPLDSKEIKPVNPKGNQSWIFTGRTDAEAPILWPPDTKNWLIGKDPDAGQDWRQKEKGMTEDERVGWHHWLDGHEFEQALGGGDGQGGLACCSAWGHKKLDMTEQLNWQGTLEVYSFSYKITVSLGDNNRLGFCLLSFLCTCLQFIPRLRNRTLRFIYS